MQPGEGYVPVYLPDDTVAGQAAIQQSDDKTVISITLPHNTTLGELMKENLIGLGVIYLDPERAEEINNKENN